MQILNCVLPFIGIIIVVVFFDKFVLFWDILAIEIDTDLYVNSHECAHRYVFIRLSIAVCFSGILFFSIAFLSFVFSVYFSCFAV